MPSISKAELERLENAVVARDVYLSLLHDAEKVIAVARDVMVTENFWLLDEALAAFDDSAAATPGVPTDEERDGA